MTNRLSWFLVVVVSLFLLHTLAAQQSTAPRMTLDQRLEQIEARLGSIEEQLAELSPPQALGNSAEAKLDRLEARLIRLEETPVRRAGGTSPGGLMESRLRSLERQVARLRQP